MSSRLEPALWPLASASLWSAARCGMRVESHRDRSLDSLCCSHQITSMTIFVICDCVSVSRRFCDCVDEVSKHLCSVDGGVKRKIRIHNCIFCRTRCSGRGDLSVHAARAPGGCSSSRAESRGCWATKVNRAGHTPYFNLPVIKTFRLFVYFTLVSYLSRTRS